MITHPPLSFVLLFSTLRRVEMIYGIFNIFRFYPLPETEEAEEEAQAGDEKDEDDTREKSRSRRRKKSKKPLLEPVVMTSEEFGDAVAKLDKMATAVLNHPDRSASEEISALCSRVGLGLVEVIEAQNAAALVGVRHGKTVAVLGWGGGVINT